MITRDDIGREDKSSNGISFLSHIYLVIKRFLRNLEGANNIYILKIKNYWTPLKTKEEMPCKPLTA